MRDNLDEDGQPPEPYYRERRTERLVSELLGLCKGMICDGIVTDAEALGLKRWLAGHSDALIGYPGRVLGERLVRISDGRIDDDERTELQELLTDLTGEDSDHQQPLNLSTHLPIDHPPPPILFDGMEYVFTGRMLYGPRRECEQAALARGGRTDAEVLAGGTLRWCR